MRILHLGTGFLPVSASTGRSVETTVYELTRHLVQANIDVDIVDIKTNDSRGDTAVNFHEVGVPPLKGTNIFSYFLKIIWFSLRLFPVLNRLTRNSEISIIHAHSQFPAAVALLACRISHRKVPVVYTAHNPYLLAAPGIANRLKHTLIEGWVLRSVDRVIAQTDTVGKELVERFRVSPQKIAQVFAGIDIEGIDAFIRQHPHNGSGRFTVLCPAVINPRKNQLAVVESIPAVVKNCPGCRFVFAGAIDDRAYYEKIERVIKEQDLSDYVTFTGQVPLEELYQQYRDATALVFPTHYETQGKVLIEAMAFGLPVIASRIGPIMDVVSLQKGSAVLFEPDDTEELTAAIRKVLEDESMRASLSVLGRKLASSRFSWSRIASDMLSVYRELVQDTNI